MVNGPKELFIFKELITQFNKKKFRKIPYSLLIVCSLMTKQQKIQNNAVLVNFLDEF